MNTSQELKEFDQLGAELTQFAAPVMTLAVLSAEQNVVAAKTLKEVKEFAKRIEERRKELVKPLNDRVDAINAYAKEIRRPLDAAESHVKAQLLGWERKCEEERRKEFERLEAERRAKEKEAAEKAERERKAADAVALFQEPKEAKIQHHMVEAEAARAKKEIEKEHAAAVASVSANKATGVRKTWTFRVTDASKVPAEFLVVDEKKIREAVRAGAREIAGVEIYQEASIAVR